MRDGGRLQWKSASVPSSGWIEGFTSLSFTTAGPRGFGNFFGVERDFLVDLGVQRFLHACLRACGNEMLARRGHRCGETFTALTHS